MAQSPNSPLPPGSPEADQGEDRHPHHSHPYGDDRGAYPHYGGYGYGYGRYGGYGRQQHGAENAFLGEITIGRLLRVLRRKFIMILAVGVFGFAAIWYYIEKTRVEIYRATSTIEMSVRQPRVLEGRGAFADEGYSSAREAYNTRLAKFQSSAMRAAIIAHLRALRPEEKLNDDQLGGLVRGGLEIKPRKDTSLVDFRFTHTDPELAAAVANAAAAAAESTVFEENRSSTEKAVAWLQSQAETQSRLLTEAEAALAEFRAKNNVDVIEGQKGTVKQSIGTLSESAAGLENQIVLLEEMHQAMKALATRPESGEALPADVPRGEAIAQAVDSWRQKQEERRTLATRYTDEHPQMKALDAEIASLESRVIKELQTARQAILSDILLLRQQSESLQSRMISEQKRLTDFERTLVATRTQLTTMERERDACDIAYRGILNRIEEARLSADENTALVKIVEPATVPDNPISKRAVASTLLGLIAGLAAGMGLALISDTLEDRVTSLADVEQGIGLKVIGVIPHVERIPRSELARASLTHEHGELVEAFAGIRSLLNSPQYKEYTQSILIASSAPAEGKTMVSCNLAIGSAKSGRKTLLVDFDMRRPRLPSIFGRPQEGSSLLGTLAAGDPDRFDMLPQPTDCENLDVISTRSTDEGNPAEVMAGQIISKFFEWADSRYERIIIDSPPFGIASDSAVLAALAHGVLLVCRPERTRRKSSRHAVLHFSEMSATVIGAIVNDVDFSKRSNFSNSHYYQHNYGDYQSRKNKANTDDGE